MSPDRYVVDPSNLPVREIALSGGHSLETEVLLDGSDGGPECSRGRFSAGYQTTPHFHPGAQFQLLLSGSMTFPDHEMRGPAVHYTDHHVAYGPFTVGADHEMMVLHAKPAGAVVLDNPASFKEIDKTGREIVRSADEAAWQSMPGKPGWRRKVLIPASAGPSAEIIECPAGERFEAPAPAYGRFEIVYTGAVEAGEKMLGRHGVRFVAPNEAASPLKIGPEGATLIVLTFDANAEKSYGGSNLDAIEMTAERARVGKA